MTTDTAGAPLPSHLDHAVDCIRAAARSEGHDMFWAQPDGPVHDLCVELERNGLVDRHEDVGSQFVGWRPRHS